MVERHQIGLPNARWCWFIAAGRLPVFDGIRTIFAFPLAPMLDFCIWQGSLSSVIRLLHLHQAGDRRRRTLVPRRRSNPRRGKTFIHSAMCVQTNHAFSALPQRSRNTNLKNLPRRDNGPGFLGASGAATVGDNLSELDAPDLACKVISSLCFTASSTMVARPE